MNQFSRERWIVTFCFVFVIVPTMFFGKFAGKVGNLDGILRKIKVRRQQRGGLEYIFILHTRTSSCCAPTLFNTRRMENEFISLQ